MHQGSPTCRLADPTTLRTTPVPITDTKTVTLTATIGLAMVGAQEELPSAIKRADVALYEGKFERDRYVFAKL